MVSAALLIVCANIATLLLARASARRQEMAIRLSIGASRARLLRQLLTESVLLGVLSGAAGIALAGWANLGIPRLLSIDLDLRLDLPLLLFTAALALGSSVIFGLPPALSSTKLARGPGRRASAANVLVVAQVALSLLLVTGAALLSRTLSNLLRQDLGFDRDRVVTVRIDPLAAGFKANQLPGLYEAIEQRVRAIPGVRSVSVAESTVAGGSATGANGIRIRGYVPRPREDMSILENFVEPGYFTTMGMPVLQGRDFDLRDRAGATPVAIINEAMSRRFFAGGNPLGKRYGYGSGEFEIIGVVRDSRVRNPRAPASPMAYRPIRQQVEYAQSIEVRASADPRAVIPQLRKAIAEVEPGLPVLEIATLAERVARSVADEKLLAQLSGFFAAFSLLLACIGIYGLLSYTVARRTVEIGVRMALGARRISVIELVLREGLTLVALGLTIGLALEAFATRLIGSILFGVAPTDRATIAIVCGVMLTAAFLAACVPVWRALRVDPVVALRED
jgi:predicted permease